MDDRPLASMISKIGMDPVTAPFGALVPRTNDKVLPLTVIAGSACVEAKSARSGGTANCGRPGGSDGIGVRRSKICGSTGCARTSWPCENVPEVSIEPSARYRIP